MRSLLLLAGAFSTVVAFAAAPARAVVGDQRPLWLVQARAADAIGEVLTRATARAEARVDQLRRAAREATAREEPAAESPGSGTPPRALDRAAPASAPLAAGAGGAAPAAGAKTPAYRDLFDRAVEQVRRDTVHTTDPSFDNLTDAALFREMTALQLYNLRRFVRLNQLRAEADALRDRLKTAGKWNGPAATQPAIDTPQTIAAAVQARITKGQRDPKWEEVRDKLHGAVAAAVQSAPQQPQAAAVTAGGISAPAAAAPPADDPRFQPYYYGPQDAYTGWNDPSQSAFTVQGGGGVYERYDTRVNRYNDVRTNSTFDRRVNVDADRRLNIHEDPRENF